MIEAKRPVQALVAELANLLDNEIKILDLRSRQMVAMRRHIADRNDQALCSLMAEVDETREFQETSERQLVALRRTLAETFSYDGPGQLRLSWLIPQLDANGQAMIGYRRERIVELAGRFRSEHARTAMLLRECMRINRLLLENLFPSNETATTYGAGGRTAWQSEAGMVDTEL